MGTDQSSPDGGLNAVEEVDLTMCSDEDTALAEQSRPKYNRKVSENLSGMESVLKQSTARRLGFGSSMLSFDRSKTKSGRPSELNLGTRANEDSTPWDQDQIHQSSHRKPSSSTIVHNHSSSRFTDIDDFSPKDRSPSETTDLQSHLTRPEGRLVRSPSPLLPGMNAFTPTFSGSSKRQRLNNFHLDMASSGRHEDHENPRKSHHITPTSDFKLPTSFSSSTDPSNGRRQSYLSPLPGRDHQKIRYGIPSSCRSSPPAAPRNQHYAQSTSPISKEDFEAGVNGLTETIEALRQLLINATD